MKLTLLEHTSPSFCQRLKQRAPTKVFPQDFGRNAGKYILVLNSHANVSIYFTTAGRSRCREKHSKPFIFNIPDQRI